MKAFFSTIFSYSWPIILGYVAVVASAVFLTGVLLSPVQMLTLGGIAPKAIELVVGAVGTLAAAYLGAGYAFLLQEKRDVKRDLLHEKRDTKIERDRKFNDAVLVFIGLTHALNRLHNLQVKISPYRGDSRRSYVMPALNPGDFGFQVDPGALSFLLDSKQDDDYNFLSEIVIAGWKYQSVIDVVAERSRVWTLRLKPLATDYQDANPNELGWPPEFFQTLPRSIVLELDALTTSTFEFLDREIASIEAVANELGARIKNAFPEHDLGLRVALPPI